MLEIAGLRGDDGESRPLNGGDLAVGPREDLGY